MTFGQSTYRRYLVKGSLPWAIGYVRQLPKQEAHSRLLERGLP